MSPRLISEPIDEHTTPLIMRGQSGPSSLFTILVQDPVVFTMERRMLLGLKALAKHYPDAPAALRRLRNSVGQDGAVYFRNVGDAARRLVTSTR